MDEAGLHTVTPAHLRGFLTVDDFRRETVESRLERIGDYDVEGELGRGGMGVVYLARDPRLERRVAIKRPSHAALGGERFLRESRALAGLRHPRVITTYHVGSDADGVYLVMELIEGESLAERLGRGPLPPAQAARLALGVAEALACAHQAGLVHGDVKPGNVLLRADDDAVLGDFGLAQLAAQGRAAGGSAAYAAPEQLKGAPPDPRADLYGLGATLFHMLVGRPPRLGETRTALLATAGTTDTTGLEEVPPALRAIVEGCLEVDPAARYPSARALESDLRRYLSGEPVSRAPLATRLSAWARTRRWALATLALALAVAAAAWTTRGLEGSPAEATLREAERLHFAGRVGEAARLVDTLRERPLSLAQHLRVVELLLAQGQLAPARDLLELAVERHPPAYEALNRLHELEDAAGNTAAARAALRRLATAAEAGEHAGPLLDRARGLLALERGDHAAAAEHMTRAIEAGYVSLRLQRGQALQRLGRSAAAREDFLAARALDPRHPWPCLNLAQLARHEGDLAEALTQLDRCLALDEDFLPALAERGVVRLALGDEEGAQRDLSDLLARDPAGRRFPEAGAAALRLRAEARLARGELLAALVDEARALPLELAVEASR